MKTHSTRSKISLSPGNFKGLSAGPKMSKPPKLMGGKKAPAIITNALGVHSTTGVSPMMLGKLVGHPDPKVRTAVRKMLSGF